MATLIHIDLALSEDTKTATVKLSGRSTPIVVQCLGVEYDEASETERVYLNACIHSNLKALAYTGWEPYGAITTILERTRETSV